MPNSDSSGGIYSPIPQTTVTDSESEEDLLHSAVPQGLFAGGRYTRATIAMNGGSGGKGRMHFVPANGSGAGQLRNHVVSGENGNAICNSLYNGLPSPSDAEDANGVFHADNVAILHETESVSSKKMSFPRKCCFVASLAVCFLSLVVFLWVIPCSDDMACPARVERTKTQNWIRNYEKIELKGVINVVEGVRGKSKNLILMYRGDKLFPEFEDSYKRRNGIISLIGSTGLVAWYDQMINEPKSIDCTLIDADLNGSPDCLIMDEYGQLECINPLSGEWIWHSPIYDRKNVLKQNDLLDFPLVIPDVDGDGVRDLFFITSFGETKHNKFVMISGRKGELIGDSYIVKECIYVHKLMIDAEYNVMFNCVKEKSEQQRSKPLAELYKLIKRKALDMKKIKTQVDLPQHKFFGQRKNTEKQRTITSVGGKQLVIENRGKCPENCTTSVLLTEEVTGKLLWNVSGKQLYGMQPVRLTFNSFGMDNRSTIYGFVIKFWEWSQDEPDNRSTRHKREQPEATKESLFAQRLVKKQTWVLPEDNGGTDEPAKNRRSVNQTLRPGTYYKTKMRYLKETVKLIVFNSTDIKIENTSQSNVIQFCRENVKDSSDIICQPDLNYQENSLMIADLDNDGSQELVSYYSTFIKAESEVGERSGMKLKTFVQLLRLESELPKLYNTIETIKN
ncbi:uncharacterized protein LOC129765154 [Toxorhynchites rutilus septentrionalis]|uniref:uncharacterized protein LOC129765154 n=1 Tax=Toxorhynchites rutilus septentrionalis TaxID=329112 RepID=UPI002479C8B8|nr:uncharacterized protein LOC129765154 [Toxorhynchites rutilus septentrionalis]